MRKLLFGVGVLALCAIMAQSADASWGRGGYGGHGCSSGWNDCGSCGCDVGGRGRFLSNRGSNCCEVNCCCGCYSTCSAVVVVDDGHSPTPAAPEMEGQSYETRRPYMHHEKARRDLDQERSMHHRDTRSRDLTGAYRDERRSRDLSGEQRNQEDKSRDSAGQQDDQKKEKQRDRQSDEQRSRNLGAEQDDSDKKSDQNNHQGNENDEENADEDN
jgi:hypothetical protein